MQVIDILKPKGVFVFSVDHPVRDHGYWDDNDKFVLDDYFDRKGKIWSYDFPEENISAPMTGSFKTVSDYINAVIKAGFVLNTLIEPEPIVNEESNNFATKSKYLLNPEKNPFNFEHLRRIPGTIIIKATKPIR